MRKAVMLFLPFFFFGVASAADPVTLDAAKVPPKLKPPSNAPAGVIAALGDREGQVDTVAFRPDGQVVAVSGPEVGVRLWDLAAWKLVGIIAAKRVTSMAFAPEGKLLAVGDADGELQFFALTGAAKVPPRGPAVKAHADGPLWSMAFRPDGKTLATGGSDGTIKLWDVASGKMRAAMTGHTKFVRGLSFTPDGDLLASAGANDHSVRLWDIASTPPSQLEQYEQDKIVASVSFAADGTKLAAGVYDGRVKLWKTDQSPPKEKGEIRAPRNQVRMVEFAPDGESVLGLVLGETNDEVYQWDLKGGIKGVWKLPAKAGAIAWSPSGQHFAIVTEDSTFIVKGK